MAGSRRAAFEAQKVKADLALTGRLGSFRPMPVIQNDFEEGPALTKAADHHAK
jgi:hypothetical protein